MTLMELYQLRDLNREIEMLQRELERLKASPPGLSAAKITAMPSGGYGNALEQYAAKVADLEAMIAQRAAQCLQERVKLEGYIRSIPDSLTRQIFALRFVEGRSWYAIARCVGNNTESSVKMICYRYLAAEKEAE